MPRPIASRLIGRASLACKTVASLTRAVGSSEIDAAVSARPPTLADLPLGRYFGNAARAGPSNVARNPSPRVLTSRPRNLSSSRRSN